MELELELLSLRFLLDLGDLSPRQQFRSDRQTTLLRLRSANNCPRPDSILLVLRLSERLQGPFLESHVCVLN